VNGAEKWTPVSPAEFKRDPENVFEKTIMDLSDDLLLTPEVEWSDLEESLLRFKPSVNAQDVKKCDDWTAEFGESGSD